SRDWSSDVCSSDLEAQLDAHFLGIDGVDGIERPERYQRQNAPDQRPASAGNAALELVAAAIENILQIGRIAPWPTRAATGGLPPGAAIIIAATPASVILPRHRVPFGKLVSLGPYIGKGSVRSMHAGLAPLVHFDAIARFI